MVDHVSIEKRRQIMTAIKGGNTQPEHAVRRLLYAAGHRYRLHVKNLSGKPDIVLRKYNAAIFVHGCFWHGHRCKHSKNLPKSRRSFWQQKIDRNKERDRENIRQLSEDGWRVCVIWQCALNRKYKLEDKRLLKTLEKWLHSKRRFLEIESFKKY